MTGSIMDYFFLLISLLKGEAMPNLKLLVARLLKSRGLESGEKNLLFYGDCEWLIDALLG